MRVQRGLHSLDPCLLRSVGWTGIALVGHGVRAPHSSLTQCITLVSKENLSRAWEQRVNSYKSAERWLCLGYACLLHVGSSSSGSQRSPGSRRHHLWICAKAKPGTPGRVFRFYWEGQQHTLPRVSWKQAVRASRHPRVVKQSHPQRGATRASRQARSHAIPPPGTLRVSGDSSPV